VGGLGVWRSCHEHGQVCVMTTPHLRLVCFRLSATHVLSPVDPSPACPVSLMRACPIMAQTLKPDG
jgi:hypothetical protein